MSKFSGAVMIGDLDDFITPSRHASSPLKWKESVEDCEGGIR